jgi:hypothetical protein
MAVRGELVQVGPPSSDLVAQPATSGNKNGGSTYAEFLKRVRGYVAPPPPGELGWQAVAGTGMTIGSAGLLALLPAGSTIATSGLFKWVGRSGLASTLDSVGALIVPLLVFALCALVGIGAIYGTKWGATPALVFLTGQTWLGVAALAAATLVWMYLLVLFVINIAIWAAVIVAIGIGAMFVLWIVGLFFSA